MVYLIMLSNVFYPPEDRYELLMEFEILGEPGSKGNSRQIVTNQNTGRPMVIKSRKSLEYEHIFNMQVNGSMALGLGSPEERLAIWVLVYYRSHRPDVSIELIKDLMEKAGIISNDRYIKAHFIFGEIDKNNPRSLIRIYKIQ